MAYSLRRLAQVALKVEAVEGVKETLLAADASFCVFDPQFTLQREGIEINPAKASLDTLASLTGKVSAQIAFRVLLVGTGDVTAAPAWDAAIKAASFGRSVVSTAACGAIVGGPFHPGELIEDDATQLITGRIVGEGTNGDAALKYVPVDGVFVGTEAVTGRISGATATLSGAPATNKGFEYKVVSGSAAPSITNAIYMDGRKHEIYGARGDVQIVAEVGAPVYLEYTFTGIYGGTTDTALFSSLTYPETGAVQFLDVGFSVHEYAAVFASVSIGMNNTVQDRPNANKPNGIESFIINQRAPGGALPMEFPSVADFDVIGACVGDTLGRMAYNLGGASGNDIWVAAPYVQFEDVGDGDLNGVKGADVQFQCRGQLNKPDSSLILAIV